MAKWFSARIFLAGFILLLTILLIVLVVGNLQQSKTEAVLEIIRPESDLSMQKINYTETRDGQRKWSVQADSATHDFEENSASIHNVKVVVFDQKNGNVNVTAASGIFDISNRLVTLSGEILVENVGGHSVFTEELIFDGEAQLLSSEKQVQVVSDNMRLAAVGLRYDFSLRNLMLLSSVEASFSGAMKLP